MKRKYYILNSLLILVITLLLTITNQETYSLEETQMPSKPYLNLQYTKDESLLEDRIFSFINQVDDVIIPLYEYHDELNLNDHYQFLTNFALHFVSKNISNYQDSIIFGEPYQYFNEAGNTATTNYYVPLDLIYEITHSVFNRRYYHITSSNFKIINNHLPLVIDNPSIEMNLEKIINISKKDNLLLATVKYYEVDINYQYEFEITDNRLTIRNLNIEV